MDRLTERAPNGTACYVHPSREEGKLTQNRHNVLQRLASYEDTGLTPEEIKSLFRDGGVRLAMRNNDLKSELEQVKVERENGCECWDELQNEAWLSTGATYCQQCGCKLKGNDQHE